jgi:hypothetical protein
MMLNAHISAYEFSFVSQISKLNSFSSTLLKWLRAVEENNYPPFTDFGTFLYLFYETLQVLNLSFMYLDSRYAGEERESVREKSSFWAWEGQGVLKSKE